MTKPGRLNRKMRKLVRDPAAFLKDSRLARAIAAWRPEQRQHAPSHPDPLQSPGGLEPRLPAPPPIDEQLAAAPEMTLLGPLISASERFRAPFDLEALRADRVVVSGRPRCWYKTRLFCEEHGLSVAAYLDLHREHGSTKYNGTDVVFGDEQARLDPTLPILFGTRPKKADFYASPPAPQRCFWLHPPTGRKLHPKFHSHLLARHGAELERVCSMLADEESRLTFASIIRTRLQADSGYFRVAGYPEYRHPMALARPGDTVIDGGAFDGDSSRIFAELVGSEGRVFAMEPSRGNFARLCSHSTAAGLRQIVPVAMGLWSEPAVLRFTDGEGGSSNLSPSGGTEVAVTSVDFLVEQFRIERVDLIKLDVEGAEAEALHGARQTLERMRPVLHVSIYHRPKDIFELPLMLDDWLDGYRFWMGHHNFYHTETDLYAVPEERLERAEV